MNSINSIEGMMKYEWKWNAIRYKHDFEIFKKFYEGGEILEVGSFPYGFTKLMADKGYKIHGLDLNIKRGYKFIKENKLNITKCDIEKDRFPFGNNVFGFVLFNETLEHLHINPIHALKEINRVMKNNGILMVTTPNLYHISKILKFNLGNGIDADAYTEFNQRYCVTGHAGHLREYSRKDVTNFLEKTGFKIQNISNANYHSAKPWIFGLFLNFLMWLNPKWKNIQIFISKKK